jgi:primase-like protein
VSIIAKAADTYTFPEYLEEFEANEINREDFETHARYLASRMQPGTFLEMRAFLEDPIIKAADEALPRGERDKGRSKFYSADDLDIEEMIRQATTWQLEGRGVFFGIHGRTAQRGNNDSVVHFGTLPIDSDVNGDRSKKAEALGFLLSDIIRRKEESTVPALIIDSGNGIHGYFNIEPTASVDNYRHFVKGFAGLIVGGDESINDPARVLRAAGTWNLKDKDNHGPKPVTIESFDQDVEEMGLAEAPAIVAKATPQERLKPSDAITGNRHDVVKRYAADYRNRAESYEEFESAVLTFNDRTSEPLPDDEVISICKHRWKHHDGNGVDNSQSLSKTSRVGLVTHAKGFKNFMEEEFEDLDFVVHGLPRGMIGQFIAAQSSYKTTLALNLLLSMASGKTFEPFTQAEPRERLLVATGRNLAMWCSWTSRTYPNSYKLTWA